MLTAVDADAFLFALSREPRRAWYRERVEALRDTGHLAFTSIALAEVIPAPDTRARLDPLGELARDAWTRGCSRRC